MRLWQHVFAQNYYHVHIGASLRIQQHFLCGDRFGHPDSTVSLIGYAEHLGYRVLSVCLANTHDLETVLPQQLSHLIGILAASVAILQLHPDTAVSKTIDTCIEVG